LRFFSKQINPTSFGSWCVKEKEESTLGKDSLVPLMPHNPSYVVIDTGSTTDNGQQLPSLSEMSISVVTHSREINI